MQAALRLQLSSADTTQEPQAIFMHVAGRMGVESCHSRAGVAWHQPAVGASSMRLQMHSAFPSCCCSAAEGGGVEGVVHGEETILDALRVAGKQAGLRVRPCCRTPGRHAVQSCSCNSLHSSSAPHSWAADSVEAAPAGGLCAGPACSGLACTSS